MNEATRNCAIKPEILAPAGERDSFLAALAAGADAIYCGFKRYSARMAAKNLSLEELVSLTQLAHERHTRVYVALNTLLRLDELDDTGQIIEQLVRQVKPDGLIVQDLAAIELARQASFEGELHLSTLANVTFPQALELVHQAWRVDRVVAPRELSIDELRLMAAGCPEGLKLEVFIHGALCYAVSGRCYWSSYMGGRSGLRGRCVQPCRRRYSQEEKADRFFSCQDLSLDVLVKALRTVENVAAWKIEGRKKGPHYVYYTVMAYRMLRDQGHDPQAKRDALALLERALGRPGTHYHFLPQRPQQPMAQGEAGASGFLVGRLKGEAQGGVFLSPREPLMSGDMIRIGYEDDPWHMVMRIGKAVPKAGRYHIRPGRGRMPPKEAPVFVIDRREPALAGMIADLAARLAPTGEPVSDSCFVARLPSWQRSNWPLTRTAVGWMPRRGGRQALWLSDAALDQLPGGSRPWWWLPPVIWPDDVRQVAGWVKTALEHGAAGFVVNAPWQRVLFPRQVPCPLWAGPFCNLANPLALEAVEKIGCSGAIVSPELGSEDLLALPGRSRLPLGIVVSGHWPLCLARTVNVDLKLQTAFTSPKGEVAWTVAHGANIWVYPNWILDLSAHEADLIRAGYRLLVRLDEKVPPGVSIKQRPGLWNWSLGLR